MIPGIVFLILAVLLPLSIIDYSQVDFSEYLVGRTPVITYINRISEKLALGAFLSSWQILAVIIAISYIFGHTIKVFSKSQYELCKNLFDEGLNKFIKHLSLKINEKTKSSCCPIIKIFNAQYRKELRNQDEWYSGLIGVVFGLIDFSAKICQLIFVFGAPDNYEKNITEEVKKEITKRYNIQKVDWYTVYKIANIVIAQEKLKSLSFKFLAKYNFYRSLAFIFLLNEIYIIILYNNINYIINPLGHIVYYPILIINFILWFTFHEKYKRYWALCGNESVMSLFYFWNTKGKEKNENEQKDTVS